MQPEDLIQQKNWTSLTVDEKELVAPLAANEEEFNLLKNMLSIAMEDMQTVPTVNTAIQEQLQKAYAAPVVNMYNYKKWMAIAASIIIAIAGTWFYFKKAPAETTIAKKMEQPLPIDTIKNAPPSIQPTTIVPGIVQNTIRKPLRSSTPTKPAKRFKQYSKKTPVPATIRIEDGEMAILTMVKDNKALLDYVTEVYE
jgi:hypothetical protein